MEDPDAVDLQAEIFPGLAAYSLTFGVGQVRLPAYLQAYGHIPASMNFRRLMKDNIPQGKKEGKMKMKGGGKKRGTLESPG